ncbi:MAG: alpha/beta hydrolase [Chitinophagaceae bacterium]|nr:alpha/beta hydrolase [Chitinophagaceae bacterium]
MRKSMFATFVFCIAMLNIAVSQTIDTLVDVGGYRLYFRIVKGTGMPILFEGGAGADVSVWDTLMKPVADATHATLITYDRAGYGKSELDTSNYDVDKHGVPEGVRDLEIALKKLGYDRSLMLVAHSYGGFCATLFASGNPQTVKAAVYFDANLACWFQNSYVDSVMTLRKNYWEKNKPTDNWADYYAGLNLARTIDVMRKHPFPENIPVIDLVAEKNFPDSAMAARWRDCHKKFAEGASNREGIIAYGCGHFIFKDNPQLALAAILQAYEKTRRSTVFQKKFIF